jgi:hypothetical protein
MKKFMTLMLGLSLFVGSTVAFAQGTDTTATKKAKKSKKSKKTDTATEKKS